MAKARRITKAQRINLSDYSLDINTRKVNYDKFDYREIDDYLKQITGTRIYQYEAIKQVMTYLWGGSYKNVSELAIENFANKWQVREKYGSEQRLLNHIPLPDRQSGVVHMATGTGKSWVIFAVAYLSVIMGYVDRVLVLGPSSTIIEQGLNKKFMDFLSDPVYRQALPAHLRNKAVDLFNDTDHITDNSITIENINAIYRKGGIIDAIESSDAKWLVLSDEVHHAYSHLKFDTHDHLQLDKDVKYASKQSEDDRERLWMKFLREYPQIKWHIGFTGTPYNADDFFADVIYNYSLRTAIHDKYIKDINSLIKSGTEDGEAIQWTQDKRYEVILKTHEENQQKYAYVDSNGNKRVKPITIFICNTTANAKLKSEEFIRFLAKYGKENGVTTGNEVEDENIARERVICVTTAEKSTDYKEKLDNIEEIDPNKTGGRVEFIFAVNKLSEGWDVDNVFQIVPMQDKIFNSKLLISQVLGRGLRKPRNESIPAAAFENNYPIVTIQNHEKFSEHIKEVLDAVIQSDMYIATEPIKDLELSERAKLNFSLFNLNYLATKKTVENDAKNQDAPVNLVLTKYETSEIAVIEFDKDKKHFKLARKKIPIEYIVGELHERFKRREYEGIHFDFGSTSGEGAPSEDEILQVIRAAMAEANIPDEGFLAEENKPQIELYFNQFLPRGKKKPVSVRVEGNLVSINTTNIPKISVKVSELDRDGSIFFSENYDKEVGLDTYEIVRHLESERKGQLKKDGFQTSIFSDPLKLVGSHGDYIRPLVAEDPRPPYFVNPSVFKTPQSGVAVSHTPEKLFMLAMLDNSAYFNSFIKSPDMGFYSLSYEYWKKGKDRVVGSFNPDFFILINIDDYIKKLQQTGSDITALRKLQDKQYEFIIKAIEIKSDNDDDETIEPKAKAGKEHFAALNRRLSDANPQDFDEESKKFLYSYYTFDLLRESDFNNFFRNLKSGGV